MSGTMNETAMQITFTVIACVVLISKNFTPGLAEGQWALLAASGRNQNTPPHKAN